MKRTLLLSLVLGILPTSYTTLAADDLFVPQSILNIAQGTTATETTTVSAENYSTCYTDSVAQTIRDVLEQNQQFTKAYSKRSAIVKDGLGTLVVGSTTEPRTALATKAALLVREGTMQFINTDISHTPGVESGTNFAVSGLNATLIFDHSTYSQTKGYTNSLCVGGTDGDGTLILKNESEVTTIQTLFAGGSSNVPLPTAEVPAWNVNPHKGGSYQKVDTNPSDTQVVGPGNAYYVNATEHASFSNKTQSTDGVWSSHADIQIESGSTLTAKLGFYLNEGSLVINNALLKTGITNDKGVCQDNVWLGSRSDVFGDASKAVIRLENGGQWKAGIDGASQYAAFSYYDGQQTELTITGAGSAMDVSGIGYIGKNTGKTDIQILDGGRLHFGTYMYARGVEGSHHILVDGEQSQLDARTFYIYGGSALEVKNGGLVSGQELQLISESCSLTVADGGKVDMGTEDANHYTYFRDGASLKLSGEGSEVKAYTHQFDSGSAGTISNGAALVGNQVVVASNARLENNGTIRATEVAVSGTFKGSGTVEGALKVTDGGTLIVGNSPGYQEVSSLDLQAGSDTVFCIAGNNAATVGNTGWASGTASQIRIGDSGSLTLDAAAHITIEFGGVNMVSDGKYGQWQEFSVTLIMGGCGYLTEEQLATLSDHTSFTLTSEPEGLTGLSDPEQWSVRVSDVLYTVEGDNLKLSGRMLLAPEPGTATLSLLALAALAVRRRRRS